MQIVQSHRRVADCPARLAEHDAPKVLRLSVRRSYVPQDVVRDARHGNSDALLSWSRLGLYRPCERMECARKRPGSRHSGRRSRGKVYDALN